MREMMKIEATAWPMESGARQAERRKETANPTVLCAEIWGQGSRANPKECLQYLERRKRQRATDKEAWAWTMIKK